MVYCAEEIDNGGPVRRLFVPDTLDPSKIKTSVIKEGALAGVVTVRLPGKENAADGVKDTTIHLVPYYAWNNRGEKSMIVWFPRNASGGLPLE